MKRKRRRSCTWAYLHLLILHYLLPITLTIILTDKLLLTTKSILSQPLLHQLILWYPLTLRSLRRIFQDTSGCAWDVSLLAVIQLVYDDAQLITSNPVTDTLVLLLLIYLIRSRLLQVLGKIYTVVLITVTSYTNKKMRRSSTLYLVLTNLLLSPIILLLIIVSSLMSSPLITLFTLPIFWVGFARPLKFWPQPVGSSASECPDTVIYEQCISPISKAMREASRAGRLNDFSSGSYYLMRYQDRLLWIQVVESGHLYSCVSIKGLELQETSCHTLEAAKVDELAEVCFTNAGRGLGVDGGLGCLTPLDTLPFTTYSDAKTTLTGVIDSPEQLDNIRRYLPHVLLYLLLHLLPHTSSSLTSTSPNQAPPPKQKGQVERGIPKLPPIDGNPQNKLLLAANRPSKLRNKVKDTGSTSSMMLNDFREPVHEDSGTITSVNVMSISDSGVEENGEEDAAMETTLQDELTAQFLKVLGMSESDARKKSGNSYMNDDKDDDDDATSLESAAKFLHSLKTNASHITVTNVSNFHLDDANAQLKLPASWKHVPIQQTQLDEVEEMFPVDWYHHLTSHMEVGRSEADQQLLTNLTLSIFSMFYKISLPSSAGARELGLAHVFRCYHGKLPSLTHAQCAQWLRHDPNLLQLALKAYRWTVKLVIDAATLFEELSDPDTLLELLEEYKEKWYIGVEGDKDWQETVSSSSRDKLFTMWHDQTESVYRARTLMLSDGLAATFKLNSELVRCLWASLNLELIYMTNDDEERYSIQAEPTLLRNLTTQAADPPLGYPVYSSRLLHIPLI